MRRSNRLLRPIFIRSRRTCRLSIQIMAAALFALALSAGDSAGAVSEYVKNGMPEWFALHLSTMDSALAAHLKTTLDYDQD